jgi:hypothetical protein
MVALKVALVRAYKRGSHNAELSNIAVTRTSIELNPEKFITAWAPLRLYTNPGEGVCDTVQNRSFGLYLPEKVENPETITIVSAFMKRWLPINEIGKNLMALSKEPLKNQYLSQ